MRGPVFCRRDRDKSRSYSTTRVRKRVSFGFGRLDEGRTTQEIIDLVADDPSPTVIVRSTGETIDAGVDGELVTFDARLT